MASSGGAGPYRKAQMQTYLVTCVLLALTVTQGWATLNRQGKQLLLQSHNDFRASVGASNMRLMVCACVTLLKIVSMRHLLATAHVSTKQTRVYGLCVDYAHVLYINQLAAKQLGC